MSNVTPNTKEGSNHMNMLSKRNSFMKPTVTKKMSMNSGYNADINYELSNFPLNFRNHANNNDYRLPNIDRENKNAGLGLSLLGASKQIIKASQDDGKTRNSEYASKTRHY